MTELRNVGDLKDMLTKNLPIQKWGPVFKSLDALLDRIRSEAIREAAESPDLIDHMYREYAEHPLRSTLAPAGVRATSSYLHNRADQMEDQ